MASESEIEEERRLFYVAMTRAKKVLQLSFAQTRMRNGKTESNSPSRFIREIDTSYIMNPLSADDEGGSVTQSGGPSWRQQGSQQGSRFGNTYGRSSRPITERGQMSQRLAPTVGQRPQTVTSPRPVSRPQPLPKRTPDVDFEPTPILQLKAGNRIEHNRFGYGDIIEISGEITDLKAKIRFDDHGEKILILKYAKIRKV